MKNKMAECCGDKARLTAWIVAVLGTFLLMWVLVKVMIHYTTPPPVGIERAQERAQALKDMRATVTEQLNSYGKIDEGKGIYRLPVEEAMKLVVNEWKNPAAARSNLIARVEKATAVPPPPPAAPNPYE